LKIGLKNKRNSLVHMTDDDPIEITPNLLLNAYASGVFPMADGQDSDEIFWVNPEKRGIFPLDNFHVSRSLRRRIRRGGFGVSFNTCFADVVDACADRPETWINEEIRALYLALHHYGFAHSCEIWMDDTLAGGVYGVALESAFFGESMFSYQTDGSKLALTYLIAHLKRQGLTLFDTQFLTDHLASLGAIEISRDEYQARLEAALKTPAKFSEFGDIMDLQPLLQPNTQTS
jgi:leucyl/phenylalanyl-tRNA--protein transferase